jgi:hypothetical protein
LNDDVLFKINGAAKITKEREEQSPVKGKGKIVEQNAKKERGLLKIRGFPR